MKPGFLVNRFLSRELELISSLLVPRLNHGRHHLSASLRVTKKSEEGESTVASEKHQSPHLISDSICGSNLRPSLDRCEKAATASPES